jgi:hypothetical protein
MDNPNLIYHIPETELTDTASLLDAIKKRIIEDEKSLDHSIFLRGPNMGICIELVHPDLDSNKPDNTLTIHISYEGYKNK